MQAAINVSIFFNLSLNFLYVFRLKHAEPSEIFAYLNKYNQFKTYISDFI